MLSVLVLGFTALVESVCSPRERSAESDEILDGDTGMLPTGGEASFFVSCSFLSRAVVSCGRSLDFA